ncbi:S-adenosyl-L-methionine-dependent methyltransferase [Spinellus fusiger]|nr:S-adenosyl-L-methionine-dependent methyltransferase [Spinellus fusiger]
MSFSLLLLYCAILPVVLWQSSFWTSIVMYLHALGLAYLLSTDTIQWSKGPASKEMYGLRHVLFNLQVPPKTLWLNMGYWDKDPLSYPEACESLVRKVTETLGIHANSRVLDVGYGCGDSCFYLANTYACSVTGITNEASQWQVSHTRLHSTLFNTLQDKVFLLQGSADHLDACLEKKEVFDQVVSIDSAYHYNTRWQFLSTAYSRLVPGGQLGMYDLTLDTTLLNTETSWKQWVLKKVCSGMKIPLDNLVSPAGYQQRLEAMGYTHVQVEAIDRQYIFGGFSRHMKNHQKILSDYEISTTLVNGLFMHFSIYFFGLMASHAWVQPVFVKATKPATHPKTSGF